MIKSFFELSKKFPYEAHYDNKNSLDIIRYGNTLILDLFDTFDTYEEDEDDFDSSTVGGWVTELQERFPEKREILTYKDLRIIVLDANDRVVKKVKISRMVEEKEEKKEQAA